MQRLMLMWLVIVGMGASLLGFEEKRYVSPSGKYELRIDAGEERGVVVVVERQTGREIVRKAVTPLQLEGESILGLSPEGAEWSPDEKRVYLAGYCSATYFCLIYIRVTEGTVHHYVNSAESWRMLRKGKYQGHMVVQLRKFTLVRLWNWHWLLDADGKLVGPIGDSSDLREFLEREDK